MFNYDPFRLVPIGKIAQIADTFTRNEILTPNELRGIIGFKPVNDAQADELRNRNLNQATGESFDPNMLTDEINQNGSNPEEQLPSDNEAPTDNRDNLADMPISEFMKMVNRDSNTT